MNRNTQSRRFAFNKSAIAFLGLCVLLAGCNLPGSRYLPPTLTPLPAANASATPSPSGPPTDAPTPTVAPISSDWEELEPGFEFTTSPIVVNDLTANVTLVRIDPDRYQIRLNYAPGNPASISEWIQRTGALMVINGGFFQRNNQTNGLLITDGVRYGITFDRHGGMLSVGEGKTNVRSLAQYPYQSSEVLDQAVQGRPMLIYPGGFPVSIDDLEPESGRRTAVAQDKNGRIVFLVVDFGIASLFRLRDWMTVEHPELELFVGFNLDGGTSTGMALQVGGKALLIEARGDLPSVISIHPK